MIVLVGGFVSLALMAYLAHDRWVKYNRHKWFKNLEDRLRH